MRSPAGSGMPRPTSEQARLRWLTRRDGRAIWTGRAGRSGAIQCRASVSSIAPYGTSFVRCRRPVQIRILPGVSTHLVAKLVCRDSRCSRRRAMTISRDARAIRDASHISRRSRRNSSARLRAAGLSTSMRTDARQAGAQSSLASCWPGLQPIARSSCSACLPSSPILICNCVSCLRRRSCLPRAVAPRRWPRGGVSSPSSQLGLSFATRQCRRISTRPTQRRWRSPRPHVHAAARYGSWAIDARDVSYWRSTLARRANSPFKRA
jgi:hypothetical protein